MKESLSSKVVGCDLWQHQYFLSYANEGLAEKPSFYTNIQNLMPSVLLPLYPGEKGIYGFDALHHRRSRGLIWPNECRLFWNNKQEYGCGRVPIISAMQRSMDIHKTWGMQKGILKNSDHFSWRPYQRELSLRGPEIICNSLKKVAPNAERIALALPDGCEEGIQQAILSTFAGAANSSGQLHLLRRSVAQAMSWCCENEEKIVNKSASFHGRNAGHLLVINMSMDMWEARLVPLQWHLSKGKNYLVPVDSERWPRKSLGITGWEVAQRWLSYHHRTIQADSVWNLLVGSKALKELLDGEKIGPSLWSKLSDWKISSLPHCDGLYMSGLPSQSDIEQNIVELIKSSIRLEDGACNRLGVVLGGSFVGALDFKVLFPKISSITEMDILQCRDTLESSSAAFGAALYLKNLKSDRPTYLQEIIPVDIWCRNTSRRGSEFFWKPLIEKQTLEAGKSCSIRHCPNFILPAGSSSLQLTLRRPHQESNSLEYRSIAAPIHEQFPYNVDVSIEVSVKPGAGYAKAQIITETGHLLSQLDWAAMKSCDKPAEHNPGYIAKVCEALSDECKWNPIAKIAVKLNLEKLLAKATGTERLKNALNEVAEVIKKGRTVPDKYDIYCEWRAVSSDGTVATNPEQLNLIAAFLEVCYMRAERIDDGEMSKISLQAMRHLFKAIPEGCKKLWCMRLDKLDAISMYQLLCIGNSFSSVDEIHQYFLAFCYVMDQTDGRELYWLQALGSILRYRHIALDPQFFNDELFQQVWSSVVLKLIEVTKQSIQPKKTLSAIRCLIYLLGRRRFDKSFMVPESDANQKLAAHLVNLKKNNIKSKLLPILLEQLLKLLACNASEADIQLLLSSEMDLTDE